MTVVKKIAKYSGKPYFLVEGPVGKFGVLKSFFEDEDNDSRLSFVVDNHEFEIDRDIVEVSLGGQSICVEHPLEDPGFGNYEVARQVIFELRRYAENCNKNFVSYVPFHSGLGAYVGRRAGMAVLRVEPRIFRLT